MGHQPASAADVLRAFAMDFEPGAVILQQYLTQYPEHSAALIDLAMELTREIDEEAPLDARELELVAAGMARLRKATTTIESLKAAPLKVFADAIKLLSLPVQVGLAFRERRIDLATLPGRVLGQMAEALQVSSDTLLSYLALPPEVPLARARKSEIKPAAPERVPFEKILRDAGIDEQRMSNLLRDE